MLVSRAGRNDIAQLARLLWLDHHGEPPTEDFLDAFDAFAAEVGQWWEDHEDSHDAFIARADGLELVGMAWVALLPRPPRPGSTDRLTADIQSVFVLPEHRGRGIGSALVQAASEHAAQLGSTRVTVHSGRKAVPLYERLGFESSRQLLQKPLD